MIYNPVNEVNQSNFFSFNFLKKYRGTNFSKVPSSGTAVLLQSTVPTYANNINLDDFVDIFKTTHLRRMSL